MKTIYLNLKRFDVPVEMGGINRLASVSGWGKAIVEGTQEELKRFSPEKASFVMFFPEAHLLSAAAALAKGSPVKVGCQGVYREDTAVGGNFGAFTTNRPASVAKAMGCEAVLIGHCEERRDKAGILAEAGVQDPAAVNRLLNKEVKAAVNRSMHVLYCVGETMEEQPRWQEVLREQITVGLQGVDTENVAIAYEPVWAIGPGKTPPGPEYITKIARFLKEITGGLPVSYGGGLKADNAQMLAGIPEIDGGLIALTRFSGEIGFYPDEYIQIIDLYLKGASHEADI